MNYNYMTYRYLIAAAVVLLGVALIHEWDYEFIGGLVAGIGVFVAYISGGHDALKAAEGERDGKVQ